ncbi:MAG: 30S ribosomal protein S11 [Patescibacteria group bacterium]
MGKKRVIKKAGDGEGSSQTASSRSSKKRLTSAIVHIRSTYNNTLLTLTDEKGNVFSSASAGRSGFSGSKKGTPYAASKAAEILADHALQMGVTEIAIRVNGVGSGRESAIRTIGQKGFAIHSLKDLTPVPHGFMKAEKPRRV